MSIVTLKNLAKMLKIAKFHAWTCALLTALALLKSDAEFVNITKVYSAVAQGAVCLDGSPPAYHLSSGWGSGLRSWVVHLEGGGWCRNQTTCGYRKDSALGSSNKMDAQSYFSGILSNDQALNPDFYNWNRVKIRYCDGSSFTGDVEERDPVSHVYYRGARIWLAVMQELLARGMREAETALLTGSSAGGLASILHCDSFRGFLPSSAKVKCLSDAGYFVHTKDIAGEETIKAYYNDVVTTHGSAKNLPGCNSAMEPAMCFFPQYMVHEVKTPLFILNSAYDSWQVSNILVPDTADPNGTWKDCKLHISQCSPTQLKVLQEYRGNFLNALKALDELRSMGMFINSCFIHGQTEWQEAWFGANSPTLNNTRIATAIADWFYDRRGFVWIDCPYPCDSTCLNL
ncbi:pectin acetylesterase 8-like [Zingiber officinale]|uniref:pectin acetylesterase 8-like n=1 Tax=Zingiber officinale TaxID=94328 RepID=UPI001C4D460C|nr:pectin acetylesterase 8-like [Zingiber officinale]